MDPRGAHRHYLRRIDPRGKSSTKNTLVVAPARPGTYQWAAGFRKGAYVDMCVKMSNVSPPDWYFTPPGLFVTEKSIAPSQISQISPGHDEGHKVLLWVHSLMRHATGDIALMGADD